MFIWYVLKVLKWSHLAKVWTFGRRHRHTVHHNYLIQHHQFYIRFQAKILQKPVKWIWKIPFACRVSIPKWLVLLCRQEHFFSYKINYKNSIFHVIGQFFCEVIYYFWIQTFWFLSGEMTTRYKLKTWKRLCKNVSHTLLGQSEELSIQRLN